MSDIKQLNIRSATIRLVADDGSVLTVEVTPLYDGDRFEARLGAEAETADASFGQTGYTERRATGTQTLRLTLAGPMQTTLTNDPMGDGS